jgi:hypothetical protein
MILLGRPRRRLKVYIGMDLREVGWEGVDWMRLAEVQNQWGGSCEHSNEPSGFIKVKNFLTI